MSASIAAWLSLLSSKGDSSKFSSVFLWFANALKVLTEAMGLAICIVGIYARLNRSY